MTKLSSVPLLYAARGVRGFGDGFATIILPAYLTAIGYDAIESGTLAQSWRQEPGSAAYGALYGPLDNEAGTPARAAALRARIADARPQASGAAD